MQLSFFRILYLMCNVLGWCSRMARAAPMVTAKSNAPAGVPDFAIKYAPLVYLHPQDKYGPSDLNGQITNTTPRQEFKGLTSGVPSPLTLENLDQLNSLGKNGSDIYLTSNDDISKNPTWILGVKPNAEGKTEGATTCAVIVADKGNGIVDVFYMYFYAYNWGGVVGLINKNLGNHVGDWEHTMVRFQDGVPQAVWLSAHAGGQTFKYSVLQKDKAGIRPVVYSANGSHANYAITGTHNHDNPDFNLPIKGFVNDFTEAGPLWDPIQSAFWYSWTAPVPPASTAVSPARMVPQSINPATNTTSDPTSTSNSTFISTSPFNDTAATASLLPRQSSTSTRVGHKWGTFTPYDPSTPVGYLYFLGRWGDFRYPKSDPRQDELFDAAWKYDSGPTGPGDKKLDRKEVCPKGGCKILTKLAP